MPETFARVALLGLGLMGGSLGLALRAGGLAGQLVGYDATPGRAEQARERGAIEIAAASPAEAVQDADLVVLAAPVLAERDLLAIIAPHLAPQALVTDLGSTKAAVLGWARELLLEPSRFIGGHPMVGRERSGIVAAEEQLYAGAVWCLTPADDTPSAAIARLADLIRQLGARPLILNAERHDWLVAGVSHLPLIAAVALMQTVADSSDWPAAAELAAGGLRDMTRLASGDPFMSRDIALTNGPAIAAWLDSYLDTLHSLRSRLATLDTSSIEALFFTARNLREEWQKRSTS